MELTYTNTNSDNGATPVTTKITIDVPDGSFEEKAPLLIGDHKKDFPYWYRFTDIVNSGPTVTFDYKQLQLIPKTSVPRRHTVSVVPLAYHNPILDDDLDFNMERALINKCNDIAITKALANARKADVNLGMLIKERAATLAMIRDRSSKILNGARAIQERDVAAFKKLKSARQRRRYARNAASSHLEAIFGWAPLFDEIAGAIDHLAKPEYKRLLARGRHTVSAETYEKSGSWNGDAKLNTYSVHTVDRKRTTYSSRVTLKYTIKSRGLQKGQRLGANASYLLFDSIPLSFVTGWFSNLNHVIQAIDPILGASYFTGSASNRKLVDLEREVYMSAGGLPPNTAYSSFTRTGSGFGVLKGLSNHTERSVFLTEPKTKFVFYNNFTLYSVLASVSLVLQKKLKPLERALKAKPFRYRGPRVKHLPPIPYIL